jgi:hypothetical protein
MSIATAIPMMAPLIERATNGGRATSQEGRLAKCDGNARSNEGEGAEKKSFNEIVESHHGNDSSR